MSKELISGEKSSVKQTKPADKTPDKQYPVGPGQSKADAVLNLQRQVGNQAVQRLIAQRSSEDGFDLDDGTSSRINQARGGGQSLDSTVQKQMSGAMGHDFSGVRVHTGSESDSLNQQLNAKAFTTGQDIFFKQGEYNPHSGSGQELIAHELTHVVQQSEGKVGSSAGGMTVRPAGDAFEQEADAMAKQATSADVQTKTDPAIQRQDEDELQMKPIQREVEEEEMVQPKTIQRQDEDELQMKPIQREEEEEEMVQPKAIQRQDEDELQMKSIQREEEEEMQTKRDDSVQREQLPDEEETLQGKFIQRQEELPEEEI